MQRRFEKRKCKSIERTLFASAISIILCCGALFGTAYAWMMDSVSHDVATIRAGTLEVDLVDAPENGKSFIVKSEDDQAESTVPLVFTEVVTSDGTQTAESSEATATEESITLWDVGKTYQLPAMYAVNKGTTDLAYTISIEGVKDIKLDEKTTVSLTELIDFNIQINGVGFTGTSASGNLQIADNPDTAELDERMVTVIISGKLKDNADLSNYQGMKFEGITIKIDAVQQGQ